MTLEMQKAHDADPGAWLGWVLGGIAAACWHLAVVTAGGSSIGNVTQSLIAPIAYAFDDGMIDDVALPALPSVLTLWAVYTGAAVVLCIAVAIIIGRVRRPKRAGLSTAKELRAKNKNLSATESGREPFAFIDGKGIRDRDEDTATMLAPTGMGKSTRGVVGAINRVGAGPCISTSTKPDVLRLTAGIRREFGAIWVYDPQGVSGWRNRTRWDICGGCQRDQIAMERARALVAARPLEGDSKNSGFFANASETILRCMMHAAALEGLNMESVIAWTRDFQDDTPFTILRDHPNANPGWYDDLKKYSRGDSPETASNIEQTLSGILQAFSIREILDSVCPAPGEGFDVEAFHASTDTLYLLTQSGGDALAAPVITALVEAIQQSAKRAATRTREGRLTPILTNVLDEVPNICPIPSLPSLMSDGRGHGIKTWVVAQNRDQLVARFGEHGTNTIISNSSILLQLGGSRDTKHLRELSDLADQHLREQISTSVNGQGTSTSTSTTKDNVISIGEIAHLEEGKALLLYRELAPAIVSLQAWYETKDKGKYKASQQWVLQQEGFLPVEGAA